MRSFHCILMISVFAITLNSVNRIISEVYPNGTTGILLSVIGVVLGLIAASVFFSAKSKTILSWRLSWIAAATICLTLGWFNLPSVHHQQLLKKAVEMESQIDGVKRAYPNPSTKEEKIWVLENELKGKIADLRWDYWNKMQKIAPDKGLPVKSVISFVFSMLCLLSSIFAGFVIRRIQ